MGRHIRVKHFLTTKIIKSKSRTTLTNKHVEQCSFSSNNDSPDFNLLINDIQCHISTSTIQHVNLNLN